MQKEQPKKHPLKCIVCGEYYFIEFVKTRFEEGNKIFGMELPYYECKNCGHYETITPKKQLDKLKADIMPYIEEGSFYTVKEAKAFPVLSKRKRFKRFSHLGFTYDPRDYYLIPGLYRQHDEGYLTPVFFDKALLLHYNNHPEYSVKLSSFSSGNIYHKGKAMFRWGFGINRSSKIFKWLGDLNDDFESPKMKSHLKRFQASNIRSDHDIVSKFYFSQNPLNEEDLFQVSDNEMRLFQLKNEFDAKILKELNVSIFKLDIEYLHDYYKHPILEERHQIFEAYLSLTKFLIENLRESEIRKVLLNYGVKKTDLEKDGKKIGSLKLFGLFIQRVLKRDNVDSLMTPFYVLYDLRILHGHITDISLTEKYNSCKKRLNMADDISDLDFFKVVVTRLIDFYTCLI